MLPDPLDQQVEAAFQRHKQGDLRFANLIYRQVLSQRPNHPAALHYLGLIAQQMGHSKDAAELLKRSISFNPKDPRAHNHLGQIQIALKDNGAAARCFERALELDRNNVEALNNLANVVRVRDLRQAIELYRRALALNPRAAFAAYNLAQALNEDNEVDEALALFAKTIELDPRHCEARHNLAMLLEQRGRFEEAVEQYLAIQRLQPAHVSSLANLLGIRDYQPDAATVANAEALLKTSGASDDDRVKLHHGLGKHYDRRGAFDLAFDHFSSSKTILRNQGARFDAAAVAKSFDALQQAFTADMFGAGRPVGSDSERPVFIVGLPRSGTTLTEQILASHPRVFGAGELRKIPEIVKFLRPDYPDCIADMDVEDLQPLAQEYLAVLDDLAGAGATRVSDKLPTNALHLGMIATLFPKARIVHCVRDPLDIALSCLVELFDLEQDYTTSFEDFGRYFLLHEQLMAHWRTVLPIEIHELRYEDMVADPEATSRALVDYCGLEWDPRCLDFTRTERTVKTPSRWQVRQPIYARSVGRWGNYAGHMSGLAGQLQAAGYAVGDGMPDPPTPVARAPVVASPPSRPPVLRRPILVVAAPRSGSTLLFETLAESRHFATLGGEAHWLVENVRALRPGAPGVESNRLSAEHVTDPLAEHLIEQILERLVDRTRQPVDANDSRVFLEKTPKNALRIPFFERIFPDARFVFLWRDPRQNLSSIMEAWRSGRFETYPRLEGFVGPWSLLLPPGYAQLSRKPLEEIAAYQWDATNRIIMDDLGRLDAERWMSIDYAAFISDPGAETKRICDFAGIDLDRDLAARLSSSLPHSRYTETAPAAEKWRTNEAEILRVLPALTETWERLKALSR
jgi:tetratricopeptide (TPR) repeat protein